MADVFEVFRRSFRKRFHFPRILPTATYPDTLPCRRIEEFFSIFWHGSCKVTTEKVHYPIGNKAANVCFIELYFSENVYHRYCCGFVTVFIVKYPIFIVRGAITLHSVVILMQAMLPIDTRGSVRSTFVALFMSSHDKLTKTMSLIC